MPRLSHLIGTAYFTASSAAMLYAVVRVLEDMGSGHQVVGALACTWLVTLVLNYMTVHSSLTTTWSMWSSALTFTTIAFGPSVALVGSAASLLTIDVVIGRRPVHVAAYNLANCALAITAAGAVLSMLGGAPGRASLPGDLLPLVAATLMLAFVTEFGFIVAKFVHEGSQPSRARTLRRVFGPLPACFQFTSIECLVGLAAAVMYLFSPWGVVLIAPLAFSIFLAMHRGAQMEQITESALESFANIVDERDRYTFEHSTRVCEYAVMVGEALGYGDAQLKSLYWTSKLHDLGKVAIDNAILNKPGRLTHQEFEVMKTHPEISARLLNQFSFSELETDIVRCHHERYDGQGYIHRSPEFVPQDAYIIAVADSYDAMTTDRPYRKGMSKEVALAEIHRSLGTQFHPLIGQVFLDTMGFRIEEAGVTAPELGSASQGFLAPDSDDELQDEHGLQEAA